MQFKRHNVPRGHLRDVGGRQSLDRERHLAAKGRGVHRRAARQRHTDSRGYDYERVDGQQYRSRVRRKRQSLDRQQRLDRRVRPCGQLGKSGSPPATVSLSGGSISSPEGLAFDASGNLWIANAGNSTVAELTTTQLTASGSPTASVIISAPGSALTRPVGLAFDASGDLWVSNSTPNTVVEYTPVQLAATGDPAPAVKLSSVAMSLSAPQFLAFDGAGNLWVANGEGLTTFTVAAYTPAQLAAGSGNPVPAIVLSSFTNSDAPAGLAFDGSGNLWVSTINSIVEFTPSQINATGTPTPTITITGSALGGASGMAFSPQTKGLPLQP